MRLKRRVYWSLSLTALAVLLITALASIGIYYQSISAQTRQNIKNECGLISAALDNVQDNRAYLQALRPNWDNARVTLVLPNGTVAYDSRADEESMQNHAGRPEILEAWDSYSGEGEDVRTSDTLGQDTYYYAIRLSDNSAVLRLSYDTGSVWSALLQGLPMVLLIAAGIFLACLLLSGWITGGIVRPLVKTGEHLDDWQETECYDELLPFLSRISHQNSTIREQLEELRTERDTVDMILENMKEGLVFLDSMKRILSLNSSAVAFLAPQRINRPDFTGRFFVELTRSTELQQAVEDAIGGENAAGLLSMGDKTLQYIASPVANGEAVGGVLLFLLDVTERQKAQKIREEFTANVSHELKTPLTSITGFAELLKGGMVKSRDEERKFAGLIYEESHRLLSLIDDVMRLSEIEEGKTAIREKTDLALIARETGRNLSGRATAEKVKLTVEAETACVYGNSGMLRELVQNLGDNAIKYNRPGGNVSIRVRREGKDVLLTVEDTGIGIPREHQERIFERFYRVDKSRSKQTGGTGLGLSIVKHIVEFHHGTLQLQSQEGKGTAITVTLPAAAQ